MHLTLNEHDDDPLQRPVC